jgi:serine protease inhibitor
MKPSRPASMSPFSAGTLFADTQRSNVDPRLIRAASRFGLALLRQLTGGGPARNLLISPGSLVAALAMTYNGASGETARAIAETLRLEDLRLDEINRGHSALRAELASADPKVTLAIANSLWARQGIEFLPDFMERNRESYGAEIATLDFADPQARASINRWVSAQTQGKIETIIDAPIAPLTILFLVNALYFKGRWHDQFDKSKTKSEAFHLADGREKPCQMMVQSGKYGYYEDDDVQVLSLPYGTGRFDFSIFLPAGNVGLAGFWKRLDEEHWSEWTARQPKRDGNIALPRFKVSYGVKLNDALTALGMGIAFDANRADFSAMCPIPPLDLVYIAEVMHKTFLEVNEEGTEAAAVTKVEMATRCIPPPPFQMIVDRPFGCAVRDNATGALLFLGCIVDPE